MVIVGDMIPERLAQAKSFGCETIDLRKDASLGEQIAQIVGVPEVDSAVDCVGLRSARPRQGRGRGATRDGAEFADGGDPRGRRASASRAFTSPTIPAASTRTPKSGTLGIRIGLGWAKSHTFATGQCPVMRYNRQLMQAILHDKIQIAKAVNVTMISLDEAPQGYKDFDKGAAKKFVIDPHGMVH